MASALFLVHGKHALGDKEAAENIDAGEHKGRKAKALRHDTAFTGTAPVHVMILTS